jgi:serine/threonine-protein kinase RsbW
MRTAIFPAKFDQLDSMRQFAIQAATDIGMDEPTVCAVEMAMDEACSNIIEHAYEGMETGDIECTCEMDDGTLSIILRDHGCSFDVTAIPSPDISAALVDRPIGGLGVFLMRQLMDEIKYERMGELGNVLTMVKHFKSQK